MSVVSSSLPRPPFELKNATLTLIALVLGTTDLERLSSALEEQFGPTPALFDQDPVVIDLSALAAAEEGVDFERVVALLRARRMLPVGVEGGTPQQHEAALAAGLAEAATFGATSAATRAPRDARRSNAAESTSAAAKAPETKTYAAKPAATKAAGSAAAPAKGAEAQGAAGAPLGAPTLVIDRPLRSGQQVYARGGDLVVMAAVNFGAEVIADGHIHVYAPLRGRAIAGARGHAGARIFSTCMEPQLVAIAGTYRTTETALPADVLGKPAQVRLEGDALVVEALAD